MHEPGLETVIRAGYRAIDLITFLTTGDDETRAWEVRSGAKAPEAAGVIHTDLERGFIRAEVVGYDELVAAGSMDAAKQQGKVGSRARTTRSARATSSTSASPSETNPCSPGFRQVSPAIPSDGRPRPDRLPA